jgi:hypothetical protein
LKHYHHWLWYGLEESAWYPIICLSPFSYLVAGAVWAASCGFLLLGGAFLLCDCFHSSSLRKTSPRYNLHSERFPARAGGGGVRRRIWRIMTLWFSMKDPADNILHAAGHGVWRSLTQSCMRAAESDWNVPAETATITQGSRTADEHLLA